MSYSKTCAAKNSRNWNDMLKLNVVQILATTLCEPVQVMLKMVKTRYWSKIFFHGYSSKELMDAKLNNSFPYNAGATPSLRTLFLFFYYLDFSNVQTNTRITLLNK